MKTAIKYIGFWLSAMLAIGVLTTLLSFVFYVLMRMDAEPPLTVLEIFKLSLLNCGLNGVLLGTIATLFLTAKYYWAVGKSKLRASVRRKSKGNSHDG